VTVVWTNRRDEKGKQEKGGKKIKVDNMERNERRKEVVMNDSRIDK
jgi:hypothetical protein